MSHPQKPTQKLLSTLVVVAALGYFVDIYDLVLFSIVRVQSLASLGLSKQEILDKGILLLNMQMAGMLIGGIFWGILGDKKGRLKVLFGSILLYSMANIANAFVSSVGAYAICRFIAGIGLAGELGAGITLVSESLSKEKRGYATMIVATVGVSGAVFASYIANYFDWRLNFMIGGVLGLLLLILRISVSESEMFQTMHEKKSPRGQFLKLWTSKKNFSRYIKCILIGMPLWYVIGVLITLSPEISAKLQVVGTVISGTAIMCAYAGLVIGDFASGALSQLFKSRRKSILLFLTLLSILVGALFGLQNTSAHVYYALCFCLGLASGYWAVFVTVAAEQFGTNLRSTVAITVPNFVRGAVIPMTIGLQFLKPRIGLLGAVGLIGTCCIVLAFWALATIEETYGKDLEFLELT